jgi:hypothetical protein
MRGVSAEVYPNRLFGAPSACGDCKFPDFNWSSPSELLCRTRNGGRLTTFSFTQCPANWRRLFKRLPHRCRGRGGLLDRQELMLPAKELGSQPVAAIASSTIAATSSRLHLRRGIRDDFGTGIAFLAVFNTNSPAGKQRLIGRNCGSAKTAEDR